MAEGLPRRIRLFNMIARPLLRLGVRMGPVTLLSVPGRTSGIPRATPVTPFVENGQRYIVAGFATADWVKNARAAGWAILSRGRRSERVKLVEVPEAGRAPLLRAFVRHVRGGRDFFEAEPDSPLETFVAIAPRHPVFRIEKTQP